MLLHPTNIHRPTYITKRLLYSFSRLNPLMITVTFVTLAKQFRWQTACIMTCQPAKLALLVRNATRLHYLGAITKNVELHAYTLTIGSNHNCYLRQFWLLVGLNSSPFMQHSLYQSLYKSTPFRNVCRHFFHRWETNLSAIIMA